VAQWGQVFALDPPDGEAPQIIEELQVTGAQSQAVIDLADRWRAAPHPSLVGIADATLHPLAGGRHAIRIRRFAPRGSLLHLIAPKLSAADERLSAALLLDLARAASQCHAKGLILGSIAPQNLILCPPGLDDLPAVRLCEAGLPSLVLAATAQAADAQHSIFHHIFPCLEVAAPELLGGNAPTAASDAYAIAATAAWLLLRHHIHDEASPALIAHAAGQGLSPDQIEALHDVAPTLGPVLCKALAVNPWARAGALAELSEVCARLTASAPTFLIDGQEFLAPWGMRSFLIPLAAFATAVPYAEHFAQQVADRTQQAAHAGDAPDATQQRLDKIAPADRARLRAALQRLEAERAASQQRSEQQERGGLAKILVIVLLLLACAAIVALGTRRSQRIAQSIEIQYPQPPKPKAKVRREVPKPRILLDAREE